MSDKYVICYDTERIHGEYYADNQDTATMVALDILYEWMEEKTKAWTGIPTKDQVDAWNHMIGTSTTFVYERKPGKDEPDEEDVVWDMNDDDLKKIGWVWMEV